MLRGWQLQVSGRIRHRSGFQAWSTVQNCTDNSSTRLKTIWSDNYISLSSKIRLMRSLVISVLLYACETWTLTADILKKLQATEMRCFRKLLDISYRDHITNDAVRDRIRQAIGPHDDILTTVKKRKLKWFGHVSRSSGLAKTILQGTVQGGRRRDRQKKRWENNIAEWTGLKFCDRRRKRSWKQNKMEGEGCNARGAPTVIDYGISDKWQWQHVTAQIGGPQRNLTRKVCYFFGL